MFSVFRRRYSICFLLKVLIMFSVEGTQYVFVERIQYVFC